jgi:hypothetical protein
LSNTFDITNRTTAAKPDRNTKTIKKSFRLAIVCPKICVAFPPSGYNLLNMPAKSLAMAFARNQTPISRDANLTGDNLATIDKPIGERHNSPNVCRIYIPNSQNMEAFVAPSTPFTPNAITR